MGWNYLSIFFQTVAPLKFWHVIHGILHFIYTTLQNIGKIDLYQNKMKHTLAMWIKQEMSCNNSILISSSSWKWAGGLQDGSIMAHQTRPWGQSLYNWDGLTYCVMPWSEQKGHLMYFTCIQLEWIIYARETWTHVCMLVLNRGVLIIVKNIYIL